MKKFLEILSIVTIAIAVSFVSSAIASIEGSPHDISTKQCDICHGLKSDTGSNPQWDTSKESMQYGRPNDSNTKYGESLKQVEGLMPNKMYASPTSDMSESNQLGPQSLFCFTCHNGIFSELIKTPGDTDKEEYAFEAPLYAMVNRQADFQKNHPVGFSYVPRKDTDLNNFPETTFVQGKTYSKAIMGKSGALYPLYGMSHDRFECTTCHTPHYDPGDPFKTSGQTQLLLRVDNSRSVMCKDCHIGK